MEMAYRDRWQAEIEEMRRILADLPLNEECKWGKPTFTVDGKNVVILQGFKEYFTLGFFQCVFRRSRSPIPGEADHAFRTIPIARA